MNPSFILAWLELGFKVIAKGAPAWEALRKALEPHGIETDNATLNANIVDAERRRLIALGESGPVV